MATQWQPAPTYEMPVQFQAEDPEAQKLLARLHTSFSPNWLNWFLELAQLLTAAGGGGGLGFDHNLLLNLQGGTTDEYYHLTANQHSELVDSKPANQFYAGPASGADAAPAFRTGVAADITFTATQRLEGRNSASGGKGEEVSISTVLDWISSTRGTILYRGASGWAALAVAPAATNYFLQSGGTGADPNWALVDTTPDESDPHWEPVSNMNPAAPELLFDGATGDVIMGWVS